MIRFTKGNWERFTTNDKSTTIRTRIIKPGLHNAFGGSRYKPVKLGTVEIKANPKKKLLHQLTNQDALNDGFDNRVELILELGRLNKEMDNHTPLYIHKIKVVKEEPKFVTAFDSKIRRRVIHLLKGSKFISLITGKSRRLRK